MPLYFLVIFTNQHIQHCTKNTRHKIQILTKKSAIFTSIHALFILFPNIFSRPRSIFFEPIFTQPRNSSASGGVASQTLISLFRFVRTRWKEKKRKPRDTVNSRRLLSLSGRFEFA